MDVTRSSVKNFFWKDDVRNTVMWHKTLFNNGGRWVLDALLASFFTAAMVTQPLVGQLITFSTVIFGRWVVGCIDYMLGMSQRENEIAIKYMNPYLDKHLKAMKENGPMEIKQ